MWGETKRYMIPLLKHQNRTPSRPEGQGKSLARCVRTRLLGVCFSLPKSEVRVHHDANDECDVCESVICLSIVAQIDTVCCNCELEIRLLIDTPCAKQ
jgi:hypothetical protein